MNPTVNTPRVTVLTTTYNRAHTLPRLYQSLLEQTLTDFEWVIIDDGSNDGTDALVEGWHNSKSSFNIRYFWHENRGKHVSLNRGIGQARGELCAVIDSDDWYPATALQILVGAWDDIREESRSQYANVEGLSVTPDGTLIGSLFPADVFDSDNFDIRIQRQKNGDTHGMYRTQVLKQFPFPEQFQFVREGLVWNRIAEQYRTRFINKVTGIKEYLQGGLTKSTLEEKIKRGESDILFYQELLRMKRSLPVSLKRKAMINMVCMGIHHRKNLAKLFLDTNEKVRFIAMLPFGVKRFLRQKLKVLLVQKGIWKKRGIIDRVERDQRPRPGTESRSTTARGLF